MDTKYSFVDSCGKRQQFNYYIGKAGGSKPGAKGSYTTNGYRADVRTGGHADMTSQKHIFIADKRLNPPSNSRLDHRTIMDISNQGFKPGHYSLDSLKPLSETVFHELTHAVGGREFFPLSLCQ